jgi:hypothetical protein
MKLQRVTPEPFAYLHCIGKGPHKDARRNDRPYFNTDTQHTFADLDGEAYYAYYCEECAQSLFQAQGDAAR